MYSATLVLHLRASRRRARQAAVAEVVALLRDGGAHSAHGGPLAEHRGIAWVSIDESAVTEVSERLQRLGYSERVELVRPAEEVHGHALTRVRWKGRAVALVPVFDEPDAVMRRDAPDRRSFLLECGDGVVRQIHGYRGGSGAFEHRALPVEDARLLVNLVANPRGGRLLDPFAGAGAIVIEARRAGWSICSLDIDPTLRYGLAELADRHVVGDATALPFAKASVDAIATEPPYHESALGAVRVVVGEIARVLRPGGRAALLAATAQAPALRAAGTRAGLIAELDTTIDRKGTEVTCLCWGRR